MPKDFQMQKPGIYIHIPYCLKKCNYCAFNSYAGRNVPKEYIQAVISELSMAAKLFHFEKSSIDSIYFGGGTPSLLDRAQLASIMEGIQTSFNVAEDVEVTLELNPATADTERLEGIRKAGINRLSIGIQSFKKQNLDFLGRLHTAEEARKIFHEAREAGFGNLSIDLIFAIPGQEEKDLLCDLDEAAGLKPEHISLYSLTLEKGTPLNRMAEEGSFKPGSDALQAKYFHIASSRLKARGYKRYETSNYAVPGFESRHNLKYWSGESYLGIGAGAHSFMGDIGWGARWWNHYGPADYIEAVERGNLPLQEFELANKNDALMETVFTALRTDRGLYGRHLFEKFGLRLDEVLSKNAVKALEGEMINIEDDRLILTEKGALMADDIALKLLGF